MSQEDGRASASWPRFRRVWIAVSGEVPERIATLLADGIPAALVGDSYTALDTAVVLAGGELVAFGGSDGDGRICLETATGRVVALPVGDVTDRTPVNADLDSFTRCVEAVLARFPFYADGAGREEVDGVADDVTAALEAIDPTALEGMDFWYELVWGVRSGDYSTEELTVD